MADVNVVIETDHVQDGDGHMLFCNEELCECDTLQPWPKETTWPDLLVEAGVFSSKSQARKAGFTEIPWGWTDRKVGKLKTRFCVWKPRCYC